MIGAFPTKLMSREHELVGDVFRGREYRVSNSTHQETVGYRLLWSLAEPATFNLMHYPTPFLGCESCESWG
jgi:hypothetical protein